MIERAHVYVKGFVQGVSFRANAKQKALSLRLSGWVRNVPDGRVELVFEGEKDKVSEMIEWCKNGPVGASVESVDIRSEKPTGEFNGFSVKR